jgi:hypothetical protein
MEHPDRVTYFAATDSRGKRTPFGLKAKDRERHMYVIGKTGMGKSTLLENMAIQDIRNGEGVAFIDPHGGTADKLLEYVPEDRIKDVVYFAPFDLDQPIAFNVMEDVGYDKRHLVVSGLMATFKKIWEDAWSARMEYILTNTLLALLEYPDATLLSVNRMYTDKNFRKKVVDNVKDPVVKDFWTKEFANYGERYTQEATPAIQNKIGQFTGNPLIRNIIGQPKSSFDIRELMDQKKIFIINLSKGLVGETNMRLLGSMLTTRIFLAAMSRAEHVGAELDKLPPFYFYVDEFQNFANDTFAEILSEARKYHLSLIIAHQYVEQMEEQVRAAVFGNVGTTVAFRVGPFDAETLETVFFPEFTKEDLVNLAQRQIYLSLMIDGVGSRPFSAITLPPIEPPARIYKKEVIESSRTQFGAVRAAIEESIIAEYALIHTDDSPEEKAPARAPVRRSPAGAVPTRATASAPRQASQSAAHSALPNEHATSQREPREEERPAPRQRESERRETPMPPQKSAEDLKSILRKMTAEAPKSAPKSDMSRTDQSPRGAVVSKKPDISSLKHALADVLSKQAEAPKPKEREAEQPKEHDIPKEAVKSSTAFEVPEETLRKIFKEQ